MPISEMLDDARLVELSRGGARYSFWANLVLVLPLILAWRVVSRRRKTRGQML